MDVDSTPQVREEEGKSAGAWDGCRTDMFVGALKGRGAEEGLKWSRSRLWACVMYV